MESETFDALIRRVGRAGSRRGMLRVGVTALAASAVAALGLSAVHEGDAIRKKKKKSKKKKSKKKKGGSGGALSCEANEVTCPSGLGDPELPPGCCEDFLPTCCPSGSRAPCCPDGDFCCPFGSLIHCSQTGPAGCN